MNSMLYSWCFTNCCELKHSIAVVTMSSIYLYLSIKHYVTNCNANPFLKNRDEGLMIPTLGSPLTYFAIKYDLNILYSWLVWASYLIHLIYIVTLKTKKIYPVFEIKGQFNWYQIISIATSLAIVWSSMVMFYPTMDTNIEAIRITSKVLLFVSAVFLITIFVVSFYKDVHRKPRAVCNDEKSSC